MSSISELEMLENSLDFQLLPPPLMFVMTDK